MSALQVQIILWIAWSIGWTVAGFFVHHTRSAEGKLIRFQHLLRECAFELP